MAILKVGDYVLVEGKVGRITMLDFTPKCHGIWLLDGSMPMAIMRQEQYLTPIDPAFHNLLTDVHKEVSDE